MDITLPAFQVRKVHGNGYVSLYVRRVNQSPLYFIVYKGTTIHLGKRKSMVRQYNYYRGKSGAPVVQAMATS